MFEPTAGLRQPLLRYGKVTRRQRTLLIVPKAKRR